MTATAKKLIAIASLFITLALPSQVYANDEIVCTVIYGQGEVCGIETREGEVLSYTTVEAGSGDFSFLNLAVTLGLAGAVFFILSCKTKGIFILDR